MTVRRFAPGRSVAIALTILCAQAATADYTQIWEESLSGYTQDLAVDGDGNSYVGITSASFNQNFVESYDRDGKRRWRKPFGEEIRSVAVTADGAKVVALGTSRDSLELWVAAYEGAKGQPQGSLRLQGIDVDTFIVVTVSLSPDDASYYVGGTGFLNGQFRAYVARFSAENELLWARFVGDGLEEQFVRDIAADPRGDGVYFVGDVGDPFGATTADVSVGKFDADGNLVWHRRYNGPTNESDQAGGIAVHPKGKKIYVGGSSGSDDSGRGVLVMMFTDKGKQKFARRHDTEWYETYIRGAVLSADGKSLHLVGLACRENFGKCDALMFMTDAKGKKPSLATEARGATDDAENTAIGLDATDGSYRILGGTLDGSAYLGSYRE